MIDTETQLNEILENPHKLTRMLNLEPKQESQTAAGISDMQVFHDEHGETYIKYKRDHAYEVHHMNNEKVSGKITGDSEFNPRYIATSLELLRPHVENKETVRVSAVTQDGMIDKYHRMAKMLVRKNKYNVRVTELEDHPTDSDKKLFYIQQKVEEGVFLVQQLSRKESLIEWTNTFDKD